MRVTESCTCGGHFSFSTWLDVPLLDQRLMEFRERHAKCGKDNEEERDPNVGVVPGSSGVREDPYWENRLGFRVKRP